MHAKVSSDTGKTYRSTMELLYQLSYNGNMLSKSFFSLLLLK
jgi:hypothetical protein